jgi:hypothetical protein
MQTISKNLVLWQSQVLVVSQHPIYETMSNQIVGNSLKKLSIILVFFFNNTKATNNKNLKT